MRRKAFTLVELLVVIGIIALLISILLPSLNKARQMAVRTKCLNNCRQLCVANQMYLSDYKQVLPFSNWDGGGTPYSNVRVGWLYEQPLPTADPAKVETGTFWTYLKSRDVYRCPAHIKAESVAFGQAKTDALTSYLMNGAVSGYGQEDPDKSGKIIYYKINKFKSDDFLLWEADERGGSAWNDGASRPDESFNPKDPGAGGLTARHGRVAMVGCFDGHAEWINHADFYALAIDTKPNHIYCKPDSANGR